MAKTTKAKTTTVKAWGLCHRPDGQIWPRSIVKTRAELTHFRGVLGATKKNWLAVRVTLTYTVPPAKPAKRKKGGAK